MSILPDDVALREADRCVKCGLCLPHCPTYRLHSDENESPRGRIALVEGLLRGQLAGDDKLAGHLYNCLLCRNCETACPSGVRYGQLLDAARAHMPRPHWSSKLALQTGISGLLSNVARLLPVPGNTLSALARALPRQSAAPRSGTYLPRGTPVGRVGLFLGCVTRSHQGNALSASLGLLTALGYEVVVPADQGCCGALAQHQGDPQTAQLQVTRNQAAFGQLDTLVSIASGCSVQLKENPAAEHCMDIMEFLSHSMPQAQQFLPLAETAALHLPCTAVNGLRIGDAVASLLRQIPNLKVSTLGESANCCGAAGDHLLSHRDQAVKLRAPLLEQLAQLRPRYLLSSNVGCAMHLAEGAMSLGIAVETLHPVELLARQLADSNTADSTAIG